MPHSAIWDGSCATYAIGAACPMRFVETSVFATAIRRHPDDEQYRQLHIALMLRPEQGPVIKGTGGLRKVRWARRGAD
ncbi:MAG: hypothetical protein ABL971_09325 [Vicinamibacterales bacterium]